MLRLTAAILVMCVTFASYADAWNFHDKPAKQIATQGKIENLFPLEHKAIPVALHVPENPPASEWNRQEEEFVRANKLNPVVMQVLPIKRKK
jgi:hypothetical protein